MTSYIIIGDFESSMNFIKSVKKLFNYVFYFYILNMFILKKNKKYMSIILVGCEESQSITNSFRKLGHEAYSCDLLPCSGGHPEYHLQMDVFESIKLKKWELGIFHPPCTFVASSSVGWLSHPEDKNLLFNDRRPHPKYPNRRQDMRDSVEFVKKLYNCEIPKVMIENPIGLLSTLWKKPDQIIHPWQFGDEAEKSTCIWLKNLPLLEPTKIVGKGEKVFYKSGKSHPKWYAEALNKAKTKEERQTLRSKTFPGIAEAISSQFSVVL